MKTEEIAFTQWEGFTIFGIGSFQNVQILYNYWCLLWPVKLSLVNG